MIGVLYTTVGGIGSLSDGLLKRAVIEFEDFGFESNFDLDSNPDHDI